MVMDKGLGANAFTDMLSSAHEHIDIIKLGFGTAAVTPAPLLSWKLDTARQYGVTVMPGEHFSNTPSPKAWSNHFSYDERNGLHWNRSL